MYISFLSVHASSTSRKSCPERDVTGRRRFLYRLRPVTYSHSDSWVIQRIWMRDQGLERRPVPGLPRNQSDHTTNEWKSSELAVRSAVRLGKDDYWDPGASKPSATDDRLPTAELRDARLELQPDPLQARVVGAQPQPVPMPTCPRGSGDLVGRLHEGQYRPGPPAQPIQ